MTDQVFSSSLFDAGEPGGARLEPGVRLGAYRVVRLLGEGGMGLVAEADQLEPVRRRVALKLLKAGLDTTQFVARFEGERQALALMEHPSIARVFDAGSTPEGRPYYVMELVAGLPVTEFADHHRLTTRERVALFIEICQAVHHAHQKGVIHRDLKPSNVLVAMQDDRPAPKVIDFGIAKAVAGRLTEKTVATEIGHPLGTPAYMSPEQWEAGPLALDTRADIYSLGVMLYELLVGRLPVDPASLHQGSAARELRDSKPVRPSTRVRGFTGAETGAVARARDTDPAALAKELSGDLDWIVLKAIEPDRRRRYETAHELALDLGRYLRSEPVVARPPSVGYRLGRLLRRHRLAAAVVGMGAAGAVAFVTSVVVQSKRVAAERDRASAAAARATALNSFLEETLLSPDPIDGLGRDATVRETLDSAAARLDRDPIDEPAVRASIQNAIGWAYYKLGEYAKAEPLLADALRLRRADPGADSLELRESLIHLGAVFEAQARSDSAAALYRDGLAVARGAPGGARDLAYALVRVANFFGGRGDTTEADRAVADATTRFERAGDSAGLAAASNVAGVLRYNRGDLPGAEAAFRSVLALRRRVYGTHPLTAEALSNLGAVLDDRGQRAEAIDLYREALQIAEQSLGPEHDAVTAMQGNLALALSRMPEGAAEAESLFRRALATDRRKLGPDHPAVAIDLLNLGLVLCRGERAGEGLLALSRARAIFEAAEGTGWQGAAAQQGRGQCLLGLGRYEEAEPALLESRAALRRALGSDHWRVDSATARLRLLYRRWNRPDTLASPR